MLTFALIAAALVVCWPRKKKRRVYKSAPTVQQQKARERAAKEAEKAEAKRQKEAAAKEQAALDIPFLKEQIGNLYALLDLAEMEYASTTNANKQARFLRQINGLNKQIHAAETKLNKARAILDNNR